MGDIWDEGPYDRPLGEGARLRYACNREQKEITHYIVQLESLVEGRWAAVIRADSSHGAPHLDIYRITGGRRRVIVDTTYDEVIGWQRSMVAAMNDIRLKWSTYCSRYLEDRWPV